MGGHRRSSQTAVEVYDRVPTRRGPIARFKAQRSAWKILEGVGVIAVLSILGSVASILGFFGVSASQGRIAAPSDVNEAYCLPSSETPQGGSRLLTITTEVEELGQNFCWTPLLAPVAPGSILKFLLTYYNTSNSVENQVVFRVNMPPKVQFLKNTTRIADGSHPKGLLLSENDLDQGGEDLGNFGAMANAYVTFEVQVPPDTELACGTNDFRLVGVVQVKGQDQYYNTGEFEVFRDC